MKKIKILIEIPTKWYDIETSPLGWVSGSIRDQVTDQLKELLIEKYIDNVKLPEIKISKKELKSKMLSILAERALEKLDH